MLADAGSIPAASTNKRAPRVFRGAFPPHESVALVFGAMNRACVLCLLAWIAPTLSLAKDNSVDLVFVGDVMVAEEPGELIARGIDPLAGVADGGRAPAQRPRRLRARARAALDRGDLAAVAPGLAGRCALAVEVRRAAASIFRRRAPPAG